MGSVATLRAQSNDFGTEVGASYSLKPWRAGEVTLSEQLRFKDNSTRYAKSETGITLQQSLFRRQLKEHGLRWRVGGGYAFINRQNSKLRFYNQHRFILQTSLSKDFGNWRFGSRVRLQTNYRNPNSGSYRDNPQTHLRFRLSVRYELPNKPWELELSEECYYRVADPKGDFVDKARTILSATYNINRTHSVTLYGKLNQELQVKDPEAFYCMGLSFQF